MFKNIVVGTDGSKTAEEAVRQATELAKVAGATLHVVSAYRTPLQLVGVPPEAIGAVAFEDDLERLAAGITAEAARRAEASGVRAETYVVPDDPADAILDVAETAHGDLVFVGNRGHTSGRRFLLGSVAGRVSHHARCHVMIVNTSG